MEPDAPEILAALGHPARLAVFRLLVRRAPGGVPAGEIAAALDIRPNTLSQQLAILSHAGLLTSERHGRSIRYRVAPDQARALLGFLVADCCRGRPDLCTPLEAAARPPAAAATPWNVLFLCTGNAARSIMAEAILNRLGEGRFRAWSAGSTPQSRPHPAVLALLRRHGHATTGLRAKVWDRFLGPKAPALDLVVTLCDRAANEACPTWPGLPLTAHWGLPDPVPDASFADAYRTIRKRVAALVALPLPDLDRLEMQHRLDDIGLDDTDPTRLPA